jgi:hypothetical protein
MNGLKPQQLSPSTVWKTIAIQQLKQPKSKCDDHAKTPTSTQESQKDRRVQHKPLGDITKKWVFTPKGKKNRNDDTRK